MLRAILRRQDPVVRGRNVLDPPEDLVLGVVDVLRAVDQHEIVARAAQHQLEGVVRRRRRVLEVAKNEAADAQGPPEPRPLSLVASPPLVDGAAVIAEHDLRADAAGAGWSGDRDLGGARPREEVGLERVEGPRARWRPEGLRRRRQLSSGGVARRV